MLAFVKQASFFSLNFSKLSPLRQALADAEKKHESLKKLNGEFENLLKWFDSLPNKKVKENDELRKRVEEQKKTFARMLAENEANLEIIRKQCEKEE